MDKESKIVFTLNKGTVKNHILEKLLTIAPKIGLDPVDTLVFAYAIQYSFNSLFDYILIEEANVKRVELISKLLPVNMMKDFLSYNGKINRHFVKVALVTLRQIYKEKNNGTLK